MNLIGNRGATFVACLLALASSIALVVSAQVTRGPSPREIVDGREAVAGEVLVKFRSSANVAQAALDLEADRGDVIGGADVRRLHSARHRVSELLSQLAQRSDVEYAEPNFIVHATSLPNDPLFPQLWGLFNTGQTVNGNPGRAGSDVNVTPAWDLTVGSRANVVAVIDTGVDYTHPDLAGNMWSAPTSFSVNLGGQPLTCAAGTHGLKIIGPTITCDPRDDNHHGTHVAGTIGALGNNALGVVGVNHIASIMALKFLDSTGNGSTSDAINAIEFAIQAKAAFSASGLANVRVLSNSWGGGGSSQSLLNEINRANTNNMLFVAAAGNNGADNDSAPFYPASFNAPNIISVAATDPNDNLAGFSNFGRNTVHLGAPGFAILSTFPAGGYDTLSGTSMATPHVAGAAALILSRCSVNTAALKAAILNNVQPVASLASGTVTGGRLNVYGALLGCSGNALPSVTLTSPAEGASYTAPATIPLSATASDSDGIKRVEFYQGTTLIATSTSTGNPYTASWANVGAGSYTVTAKAYDNLNASALSGSVHVTVSGPNAGTSASFVGTDTTTQGTWHNVYGGQGYSLVSDATTLPPYASVTASGQGTYTWSLSTTDVRALQKGTGTDRLASVWYNSPTFSIDLNLADGVPHQVALYVVDWDWGTRAQTIELRDAVSNVLLDSRSVTSFTAGKYLKWRVQGHVTIRFIDTGSPNAVVSGLFLDSLGPNTPPSVALTSPADGASYAVPATIPLSATASDSDGIKRVEFYQGTTLIATSTSTGNPYTASWTGVATGTYTIQAKAYDNVDASTLSAPVNVTVTPSAMRTNVALAANGGVATGSSTAGSDYGASGTINGDRKGQPWGGGGGWNDGTPNAWPDWLEVAFNGAKTIDEVDIFSVQDDYGAPMQPTPSMTFTQYGLTAFTVQYWDGTQWLAVPGGVVSGNSFVWRQLTFAALTTTKIRVFVTAALNTWSRIVEVEAYTTP